MPQFRPRSCFVAAALGALIALSTAPRVLAADCVRSDKHSAITYLLVDRTDKLKDTDALKKLLNTVRAYLGGRDGERLVIGVITAKTAESRILMDRATPEKNVWESAIKLRKQRREVMTCVDEAEKALLRQDETAAASAILETVNFVGEFVQRDPSAAKRLIIFSDMVQNSAAVSFYGKRRNEPIEKIVPRLVKENRIPRLDGVLVDVAGAGAGVSEETAQKARDFWQQIFKQSGARLRSYGPVLTDL